MGKYSDNDYDSAHRREQDSECNRREAGLPARPQPPQSIQSLKYRTLFERDRRERNEKK